MWVRLIGGYCSIFGWSTYILAVVALVFGAYTAYKSQRFFQTSLEYLPSLGQKIDAQDLFNFEKSMVPGAWYVILRAADGGEVARLLTSPEVRQLAIEANEELAGALRKDAKYLDFAVEKLWQGGLAGKNLSPEQQLKLAQLRQQIIRDSSWIAAGLLAWGWVVWAIKLEIAAIALLFMGSILAGFRDLCRNSFAWQSAQK
jgi:hypothetical protein